MSTKVMLLLSDVNSSTVTFHLDTRLLVGGYPGSYSSVDSSNEKELDRFTSFGLAVLHELEKLGHIYVMYGSHGFMATVPRVFDLVEALGDIFARLMGAAGDVSFATILGGDAFAKVDFVANPDRTEFEDNINRMLVALHYRQSSAIRDAEQTIERLVRTLRGAGLLSQR